MKFNGLFIEETKEGKDLYLIFEFFNGKLLYSGNTLQNYEIEKLSRTRANLKVQDGCNNKCSYCAINIARGKSRSNSLKNILNFL